MWNLERWCWWTCLKASSGDADRPALWTRRWGMGRRGWDRQREVPETGTRNRYLQFRAAQLLSHVRLCNPVNRSTPGLPVHHQLLESTQTHVHRVGDAISSSVVPFSSCPQSFPASGSFQMSQSFESGGQSNRVSASTSVLPMNTQDWSPLGWTGWISLQSKGLSKVFSNTTVQKHQFFGAQLSSQSNSHIHM